MRLISCQNKEALPMPNIPIMPIIVIVLLLLPIRLVGRQLKILAFGIWLIGGLVLLGRGAYFLFLSAVLTKASIAMLALAVVIAVVVGLAKGRFVLSKTSSRNIERLDSITESRRPIHVYSVRSWIIIGIMVLISVALTVFAVPNLIRGGINIAIGLGLIVSSLAYLKSLTKRTDVPQLNS
jgi:hypothetical protein